VLQAYVVAGGGVEVVGVTIEVGVDWPPPDIVGCFGEVGCGVAAPRASDLLVCGPTTP